MTENRKSLEEVARLLADSHRKANPNTVGVWLAPDSDGREIRLVEVSQTAPYTGEVLPVRFPPKGDIVFPTVVVLLNRRELAEVDAGELPLPDGWAPRESWRAL
jgi:hypothetical protein